MGAGESAYEVARRQREKAARLQRSADLWERGAAGEVAVSRALEALPAGWFGLHDIAWPGRLRANIDHVVVGPGGVFAIDAKNWSGRVEVRNQVLMQNGRRREEAVVSAAEAAIALQRLVPPPAYCMGVLCFVREEPLTGWARDVMVCSTNNLTTMLLSRPVVLSPDDVRICVDVIGAATARRSTVAAPPLSGTSVSPHNRSSNRRRSRPIATIVGATVLLVAVFSGGLSKAGEWVGDRLVDVIVQDDLAEPTPSEPAQQRKERQQKKQDRQRDGQRSP